MDFLSFPVDIIENIFSYLSYDEIAKNRVLSRACNDICSRMLNRGFLMIERRHALALKNVKTQLPRRESERRYHPLSRHCDILTSIETRISMLNMTYSKFIDSGMCCFIPGKVIDEIKRVLSLVESSQTPPRAHEVLQELRDISSMAIEHFDDKISPAFRKRMQEGIDPPPTRVTHGGVLAPLAVRQEMMHLRRRSILNAKLSLYLASEYKKFYKRMLEYKKLAFRQRAVIKDLSKRQREQDNAIADLKKRIEECDIKYSELTHTNQAGGGKAIAASSSAEAASTGQPLRHFSSQIKLDLSLLPIGTSKRTTAKLLPNMKPRKPMIKLPSFSEDEGPPAPDTLPRSEDAGHPSTSASAAAACTPGEQSHKTKSQLSMAKIRGITNEIRQLSNLSKNIENKLKRPLPAPGAEPSGDQCSLHTNKKMKLD